MSTMIRVLVIWYPKIIIIKIIEEHPDHYDDADNNLDYTMIMMRKMAMQFFTSESFWLWLKLWLWLRLWLWWEKCQWSFHIKKIMIKIMIMMRKMAMQFFISKWLWLKLWLRLWLWWERCQWSFSYKNDYDYDYDCDEKDVNAVFHIRNALAEDQEGLEEIANKVLHSCILHQIIVIISHRHLHLCHHRYHHHHQHHFTELS